MRCPPKLVIQIPQALVERILTLGSDYTFLLLDILPIRNFRPWPFCFEWIQTTHPNYSDIIKRGWANCSSKDKIRTLNMNLTYLPSILKRWNVRTFGNIKKQIESRKANISQPKAFISNIHVHERLIKEEDSLSDLLKKEEILWAQKFRANWLKWGDKNSKFFHLITIERRNHNRISQLKNNRGEWVNGDEELDKIS